MNTNFKKAIQLFQNGQIIMAKKICLKILQNEPNNFMNLNLLGIILFQNKDFKKSIELIKQSIEINPNQAEANNNIGLMYIELKEYKNAIKHLENSIKINPNFSEAFNNLGVSYKELNQNEKALINWKKAIELNPKNFQAYNNIGSNFLDRKKVKLAIEYFEKTIKINNKFNIAYFNLGNAYQKLKFLDDSIKNYSIAINLNNKYAEAYYNRGNSFRDLGLLDKALHDYKKAYKINPNLKDLFGNIVSIKNNICEWKNFDEDLIFIKNKIIEDKKIINPFAAINLIDTASILKKVSENHISEIQTTVNVNHNFNTRKMNKKIKLGYFSSDFKIHPVSHLIAGVYEQHNKSKFELFAFSLNKNENDKMTKRISSAFDHFIDVSEKSNDEIVKLSRDLNIDIAIDLMGFTKFNRFEIFLRKCAPVQINFLGFAGTFGSPSMDYILADKNLIKNESDYSEKIIYLPDSFMPTDFKELSLNENFTRFDYGIPENAFVFCCFNNQYKFTPDIFNIWMRLLKKIENSILWLKISNREAKMNILKEANLRNVDSKKIIFAENIGLEDHMSRYKLADLFLDTYPYGAHTTCADALWSGLPVLTKKGNSFSSNVSSSLLNALDMKELISNNNEEYEKIAIEISSNPEKLKILKEKLANNHKIKNLFKTKVFTKNLEKAFELVYEKNLKNLSIDGIEI